LSRPINKLKSTANFYSLEKKDDINLCICQLVKKLYKKDKNIIIIDNDDKLAVIDKLLWSFQQNSFLPHKILLDDSLDTPILLVSSQNVHKLKMCKEYTEIINNYEKPLIEYNNNANVYEFVLSNEENKIISRNKYTQYKNNSFNVMHIKYNEQAI
tara:strand:+ start:490 stop:957 length:468 start_codon:yes stop_codon:yes gene_type:complete